SASACCASPGTFFGTLLSRCPASVRCCAGFVSGSEDTGCCAVTAIGVRNAEIASARTIRNEYGMTFRPLPLISASEMPLRKHGSTAKLGCLFILFFPYTRPVPSSSLQALLGRAESALARGRGPQAVEMLAPALKSSAL